MIQKIWDRLVEDVEDNRIADIEVNAMTKWYKVEWIEFEESNVMKHSTSNEPNCPNP